MSAVIQNEYTGNNSTTTYSFTFPYLKTSDIKASLDGVATTAFTLPNATTLQFNTAPGSGVKIKIFRETSVDDLTATFYAGSAIKSEDLNDNFTQNLYKTQEVGARSLNTLGGTMTGDLTLGTQADIVFEGATADAHETTIKVVDPTADRTITFPNVTGTVVTTGDTGTVATGMIANDAITNAKIADNQIDSEHYVDGSIDTAHIADAQVTTAKIADNNITTNKIVTNAITADKIGPNAVVTAGILDGNVTTAKLAADAVTGAKIADNSIDSEHYVDGSIDSAHIAANVITNSMMTDDSVGTAELQDSSVDTARLADNAVTLAKMSNNSVGTSELVNDAVTNAKISAGAVGTTELDTGAIITSKLADDAVTTAKIGAGAVGTTELDTGAVTATQLATNAVTNAKISAGAVGTNELDTNAVTTAKIADAELKTLAGMQSGTASKLAGGTALTADIADLNQIDGLTKQTTISDSDASFPTSGAVVDYVAAQIAPLGGLEVIATELAFPNTQPASGVVISISDAGGVVFNGSGTSTTGRTVGGSTITINNAPSSLNNETLVAGVGLMVSSTGSGQVYNYHKILGKEDDIKQLSDDINDFNARYRVGSSNPTSALDGGDLFFNTTTGKLLVYNNTNTAWEEAQSIGNFFISTLSPAFDGSTQNFTITNAPTNVQQIVLSINGVIQKPNTGTSTPSEGFALDGSTIKLAAAPPTGSPYFAVVMGSTVNIGTPSNNTVSTAILQNSSVTTAKIADDAISEAKIATDAVTHTKLANMQGNVNFNDTARAVFGSANDLQIVHTGTASQIIQIYSQPLQIDADALRLRSYTGNESYITANVNGAVKLYYDNSQKLETTSSGVTISGANATGNRIEGSTSFLSDGGTLIASLLPATGKFRLSDSKKLVCGNGDDLEIFHDGNQTYIDNDNGNLLINTASGEVQINKATSEYMARFITDGAVELYHNNVKKLETTSSGIKVTNTHSGTTSGAIKINTDYAGYGHIVVRDTNVNTLAAMSVENANNGNNETNYIYRSVNLASSQWANARVSAKRHAFQITSDIPGGNEKLIIENEGIRVNGVASGSYQMSGIRVNTDILNYGGVSVRDASNSTQSNHIACFQAENSGTGTDETNVVTRSVNRNSNNWANAKYAAKSHIFTVNNTIDAGIAVRIDSAGLKFGTDTASANALDDYEEGSYNPTVTPVNSGTVTLSTSHDTLKYTKIGRLVTVTGRINIASISSPTGILRVSLPFTNASEGADHSAYTNVSVHTHEIDLVTSTVGLMMEIAPGQTYGSLFQVRDNASWQGLDGTQLSTGTGQWMTFTFHFFTNT